MHLAVVPNHVLLSMTRKFAESALYELVAFNGETVDDALTLDKLKTKLSKHPGIHFPLQKEAQISTIQQYGNLSVHHKNELIDPVESWEIVYPALKGFTKWLFRDVFDICEEFDNFQPMDLSDIGQYGFISDRGIFRVVDGHINLGGKELNEFNEIMSIMFNETAPDLSSRMWLVLDILAETVDLEDSVKETMKQIVKAMVMTAWWCPLTGYFATMSYNGLAEKSILSLEKAEQIVDILLPTGENFPGLDKDKLA